MGCERADVGGRSARRPRSHPRGLHLPEQWGFKDAPPFTILYFPYRIEDYVNGLCAAGFRIERIEEPRPTAALVEANPEIHFLAHLYKHVPWVIFVGARKS